MDQRLRRSANAGPHGRVVTPAAAPHLLRNRCADLSTVDNPEAVRNGSPDFDRYFRYRHASSDPLSNRKQQPSLERKRAVAGLSGLAEEVSKTSMERQRWSTPMVAAGSSWHPTSGRSRPVPPARILHC